MIKKACKLLLWVSPLLSLFLIVNIPAKWAVTHIPANSPVKAYWVEGTIWEGKAAYVSVNRAQFKNLTWNFNPWKLFTLAAEYDLTLESPGGEATLTVNVSPNQTIQANDIVVNMPWADIAPAVKIPPIVQIAGDIIIQIPKLTIEDQWPTYADGEIAVANAVMLGQPPGPIGTVVMTLNTTDLGIMGNIADQEANIGINGSGQLLADKSYNINATVSPTGQTPKPLVNLLGLATRPDNQGQYRFKHSGKVLPKPIVNR